MKAAWVLIFVFAITIPYGTYLLLEMYDLKRGIIFIY